MNQEKTTYFIRLLQELTGIKNLDNGTLIPLLEQMELMGTLLEDFVHAESEDDLIGLGARIRLCQKESEAAASVFLGHYGISLEAARDFLTTPGRIDVKEMAVLRGIEEKFQRIEGKALPEPKVVKKKKGRKQV